jgi:hypothetical protein
MKAFDYRQQTLVKVLFGYAQTGKVRAGIVYAAALRRMAGVYAYAYARPVAAGGKLSYLIEGIEYYMVADSCYLVKLIFGVGGTVDVIFPAHLFMGKARLIQSARRSAAEVLADKRVKIVAGKGFLCKQNLAPRPLLNIGKNFKIFY